MLKKKLVKGIALLSTVFALGACGNSGGSADGPVEIEYWHGNADTQGGSQVAELVEKFNKSQDEVKVNPIYNDNIYVGIMQNLQTTAAAGKAPAVVQIGWAYREYFDENFESVRPKDLVEKFGSDKDYIENKFIPEMANLATNSKGEMLGFPYSASTAVVFVNKDLLKEAEVDPEAIKTYDDLYAAAEQIKEKTGKAGLYISESPDSWTSQQLIESYGDPIVNDKGKAAFAGEQGIKAIDDWAKSIEKGATMHATIADGQQAFISGDVGMLISTIAQRSNVVDNAAFEAMAIELPSQNGHRAVPAGGAMLAVTAKDEEQQKAAMKFIEFLYEPENVAIWTGGTGYLPATKDATENEELKNLIENDQMFGTSYAMMPDLVPFASFPGNNGLQAYEKLRDARDRVFTGVPASEELPKAEKEINDML